MNSDDYMIVNEDGSTTGVAPDVDIFEYAKEYGGKVILRVDYVEPPYTPTFEELAAIENKWRDEQMPVARNNVIAIQYGDENVPGTEQQWKDYWLALRNWSIANTNFPDQNKRPAAPN